MQWLMVRAEGSKPGSLAIASSWAWILWLYGLRDWHGASALGGFAIGGVLGAQGVVIDRLVMMGL